jgi:hypothetical protein
MRGISGATAMVAATMVAGVAQVGAGEVIAGASGNWAGPQGGGFFFRATLEADADRARMKIWHGTKAVPSGGDPQLDVADFALTAFATDVRLEVLDGPDGSILQVVTEFADEEAEGRDVVQLRYMDFQFTIVGYYHLSRFYNSGGALVTTECEVDAWAGEVVQNGNRRRLPPADFESLNASSWHFGAAFDRGWCARFDG